MIFQIYSYALNITWKKQRLANFGPPTSPGPARVHCYAIDYYFINNDVILSTFKIWKIWNILAIIAPSLHQRSRLSSLIYLHPHSSVIIVSRVAAQVYWRVIQVKDVDGRYHARLYTRPSAVARRRELRVSLSSVDYNWLWSRQRQKSGTYPCLYWDICEVM